MGKTNAEKVIELYESWADKMREGNVPEWFLTPEAFGVLVVAKIIREELDKKSE